MLNRTAPAAIIFPPANRVYTFLELAYYSLAMDSTDREKAKEKVEETRRTILDKLRDDGVQVPVPSSKKTLSSKA